ncbi:retrovirus-related pol polyprotein from transposon TNT 1-94, partial [Tanacetum coccineum]
MKIPAWMITKEMKHTEHYQIYAEVFRIYVPLTQSQPTESTQGTHRTPSTPRSTCLTPPAPVPTVDKADEMILQDTLQVSLAEHKSQEEQEARENVELINEHLASMEIKKMVEGPENVIDDSSIPRNDDQNIPDTRLEPRSEKESLEVEITNNEEVEITNVIIPVNVNEEDEEITDEVYELKRREKRKIVEESRSTPFPTPIRSPRIHTDLVSLDTKKLQELTGRYGYLFEHLRAKFLSRKSFDTLADHLQEVMVESLPTMVDKHIKEQVEKQVPEQERGKLQAKISSQIQQAIDINIPSLVDAFVRSYMSGHILHVHPAQPQTSSVPEQQYQLYLSMKADPQLQQQDIAIWLALQMKFETFQVPQTTCRTSAVRPRDQDDPHDDAHPEGENSAKRQKTSEYEAHVTGESSGQVNEKEQDDDEIPSKQVSQDIMEEVSLTIDEAKLKKMADEMLRLRCTSGDEHQYHIDQMKNFLKSDIVWESRKEILISLHPRKTIPLVQSCQRDPEAPTLSLLNHDLLYLKKQSSGPEKIVLSLHKFPAIIFNDDDIEERTSRWVNNCVKKFNPYARYGVEHWKNPHAKIFYIKKQKELGKPKEEVYSNSKIIQVIKTYWELGHEHKFITEIVARRANECIVSITDPDYKKLNKNDIEDMYLLIMNGKVPYYAETGLLWSLSVFIRSSVISVFIKRFDYVDRQGRLNGCSRHMTGNKSFLIDYQEINGGYVVFGGSPKGGKITRKGKIRTGKLDFEDVYFVKELNFNLFSISQMCDKKNSVLFTKTECLVLSPDFKLLDESQVLLKVPRQNHMYSFDLKNVVPLGGLTCLFAKATIDESNLWHRRLCHINFKTMNKLGIRREFSVARTPQQNGVAERKNRTLIEAARTMLADSKLPTTFWAEAVNTACYFQNRVLVIKPHNKTPYELFLGRKPVLNFMRPFGCLVTILNTLDHLSKFDGKSDDGLFVGYTINSKAFRVFNTRTRFVEENMHKNFLENKPNVAGTEPNWIFDIDTLTISMNYQLVFAGNQTNVPGPQYVLLPFLTYESQNPKSSKDEIADDARKKNRVEDPAKEDDINGPGEATNTNNTNRFNIVSSPVNTVSSSFTTVDPGRARDLRIEFESMFRQEKDANSTYRMFTPVSAVESSYENLGGSTPVNAASNAASNADYPTDPLMPD